MIINLEIKKPHYSEQINLTEILVLVHRNEIIITNILIMKLNIT